MLARTARSEVALRSVPVGSGGAGGAAGGRAGAAAGTGKPGDVRKMCAECGAWDKFPAADKGTG
ncbi:hypothetical protein San01_55720 [Streptomyces angustmyceticus]|uniref:Uncharacterized protein n=1 Tax=Streptomyces angustmyceticus TaxID=285578 RepID=A0A5J4LKN9_9ACTN|nr:hypothetical protein San01_55720 [Streptomyces angustmyceticus]